MQGAFCGPAVMGLLPHACDSREEDEPRDMGEAILFLKGCAPGQEQFSSGVASLIVRG